MSLVAWYPLNKDFRNLGNSDFDIRPVNNSVTIESGGKIGKAATFNGNNSLLIMEGINFNKFLYDNDFSICFWVYNDDDGGRSIFMGNFGLQTIEYYNNCLNIEKSTSNTLRIYWNNNSDMYFNNYVIPVQKWTHIAITRKSRIIKVYKDGAFITSRDIGTDIDLGNKYQMGIGGDGREEATVFKGMMNDFRIYDHVLSESEIKEISKAKILHYNFESVYGNENIIRNSHKGCLASPSTILSNETYKGFGINYIKWGDSTGSYKENCRYYNLLQPEPDVYYTLSFWGKGNVTCVCYFYPNVPTTTDTSQGWHGTSNDGHARIFLTSEWTRYWVVWKTRSDINEIKNVLVGRILNGVGDVTSDSECYIAGVKLEKGNTATSWSPNPQDDEYDSELATTIYDISGFENNGLMSNVTFSNNCITGKNSGKFVMDNNSGVIFGDLNIKTFNMSFGCWIYKEDWSQWTQNESIFSMKCNGFHFNMINERSSNLGLKGAIFVADTDPTAFNVQMTTHYLQVGYGGYTSQLSSGWHHFFFTCNGTILKLYVDGVYKFNDTNIKTYSLTNQSFGHIGYNSAVTGSYSPDGLIDDARIYLTTLTDDDVQRIYKERAKIDSIGNMYCSELNEEERVVEYLESTNIQYIDTGVKPSPTIKWELKVMRPTSSSIYNGSFLTNQRFRVDNNSYGLGNTYWLKYPEVGETKTIIWDATVPEIYENDVASGLTYNTFSNDYNIFLFAQNGTNINYGKSRIYYSKIWDNGELIRDFLPTISTEDGHMGEPCMFDTVENKYYYNQGTGTFLTNLSTSDENINLNDKGILNCRYLIEGNNTAKVLKDENIVKVNEIKEN